MYPIKRRFLTVCLVFIGLTSLAPDGRADEAAAAQVVVENANRTFTHFIMDPNMVWFRNNLDNARGLLQIGGELSEVIFVIMSNRGLDAMLSTKAQLGADMSVAAGPVGTGARAATTDVLSFARSAGAFAGLTVEGSIINPDDARNTAYYLEAVSPSDILIRRRVYNTHASELIKNVTEHTSKN
jgi:hypothetical protein